MTEQEIEDATVRAAGGLMVADQLAGIRQEVAERLRDVIRLRGEANAALKTAKSSAQHYAPSCALNISTTWLPRRHFSWANRRLRSDRQVDDSTRNSRICV
jgi:hypothetical protein